MADLDPYELVTCPFNAAHQVERYRMHIHLLKSHEQAGATKKITCPFDATHLVDDIELDYHVTTCPKRHLFDSLKYVVDDACRPPEARPPAPPVEAEENWDEENVTSYKPDNSKLGNHIIKKAKGLTKSERRKLRMEAIKSFRPKEEDVDEEQK